jgi:plastocyanin
MKARAHTTRWNQSLFAIGWLLLVLALCSTALSSPFAATPDKPHWLAEEMPLPLSVRTPSDLDFKAVAERQYLIFNMLAGGKWAWDHGRFAEAAERWDALLRLPKIDPEIGKLIAPLLGEARKRAGGGEAPTVPTATPETTTSPVAGAAETVSQPTRAANPNRGVAVSGSVFGGGGSGPAGAVVWLKRADGATPKPRPLKHAHMNQADKSFVPRILTVTTGSTVTFNNQDPIFHDVFSLSKPNDFDSGLFPGGNAYEKVFRAPGAAQILCNIHASMLGYIVVVDTPWYAQAGRDGRFHMHEVPPGKYHIFTWHEASSTIATDDIVVGENGVSDLLVRVAGDVKPDNLVPDKYGKPRQRQLGY